MAQIIADAAGELALYFRKGRISVPKILSFFNEDDSDYSLSGLVFQMNFKDEENSATNLIQLTSGAGLTISGNDITYQITAEQSIIPKADIIWWELKETTTNRTWLCKKGAYFFYGDPKDLTDTTEVTVKLAGDTVRVTITTGGGITAVDGGTI